jgi:hypothetical protein
LARRPSAGGLPQDRIGFTKGHAHCSIGGPSDSGARRVVEKGFRCASARVVDRLEKMAWQSARISRTDQMVGGSPRGECSTQTRSCWKEASR